MKTVEILTVTEVEIVVIMTIVFLKLDCLLFSIKLHESLHILDINSLSDI